MKTFLLITLTLCFGSLSAQTLDPETSLTIGRTVWSSVNVDDYQTFATRPDMFTQFFQWNRATAWAATGRITRWTSTPDESSSWTINPCPAGWRLPTRAEARVLSESGNTWANAGTRGNAVAGSFYGPNHATCRLPDNMEGCIFLSAGGFRNESGTVAAQTGRNIYGRYWTNNEAVNTPTNGIVLSFSSTRISITGFDKARAFNIRCVQE